MKGNSYTIINNWLQQIWGGGGGNSVNPSKPPVNLSLHPLKVAISATWPFVEFVYLCEHIKASEKTGEEE